MKKWLHEIYAIAIAVGIAFLIRIFIVEPYEIPSGSMLPTLHIGDHILVRKYEYGIRIPLIDKYIIVWKKPQRGDIIVFRFPVNPSQNFIKRVIGLPGDTLEIKNKVIYINGKPFEDLYGMYTDKRIMALRDEFGPIVIPEGYYFVMGDNRDHSNDSRLWARELGLIYDPKYSLVKMGLIKGKAHVIYWSVKPPEENFSGAGTLSKIASLTKSLISYFRRIDWSRIGRQIYLR